MRPAVVLLLAVIATAGCDRAGDRDAVRSVTEHFLAAVEAGDGEGACGDLSTDTRKALESREQTDCRDAVGELQLEPGVTDRVQVYVTNAKVDLASGQSMFLSRTQEGWRLSAVGCEPEAGQPAERPFDCELEA
jgi:hypothetical protein